MYQVRYRLQAINKNNMIDLFKAGYEAAREHSAYIKSQEDHDCKLKEKGFCDCQKEEVEDSNFEAIEDKATRWAGHEHADSVDADGTCLECGAKNLI